MTVQIAGPLREANENRRRRSPAVLDVVRRCERQAFIAAFTASAVIGSERSLAPQAL